MSKKILFSIAFVLLLMSCKKETATPQITVSDETKSAPPKMECYFYNANGSEINLQLQYDGNKVSGTLNYALAEKDSNKGTIKGKVENNTLIADYTFYSEGIQSTRQVAFQFKDEKVIEGYGEMTEDGTQFKDVTQLSFDSNAPLTKTDCTQ